MSRFTSLSVELVEFADAEMPRRLARAIFLDFMNSLLTKILKVCVDLRRFYYADDPQR
jgi:hypothetical protein